MNPTFPPFLTFFYDPQHKYAFVIPTLLLLSNPLFIQVIFHLIVSYSLYLNLIENVGQTAR